MITRRGLLWFLCSLVGWRPKAQSLPLASRCPWDDRSDELHAADPMNHYADYEAFEEWWSAQTARDSYVADQLGAFDMLQEIAIYSLLCDAYRGTTPDIDGATPPPAFPHELRRMAGRLDAIEQALADYPTFAPVQLAEALARETRRLAAMLEERAAHA